MVEIQFHIYHLNNGVSYMFLMKYSTKELCVKDSLHAMMAVQNKIAAVQINIKLILW